jgi:hypothetical protein
VPPRGTRIHVTGAPTVEVETTRSLLSDQRTLPPAALPMIENFGLVVAVGVLFAFLTTVTVLPLLLVLVPAENQPSQ